MGGFAWVTLATNDSYSLGALVLAHSLKKANTAHKLVVLITPSVSQPMRDQLQTVFDVVKLVEVLDSKDEAHLALLKRPELGITFTKIHCWRLTEFDKCVFLDADTLVVRNCDELFEREELSAAPDFSWPDCFNSGVFVFKPSVETFDKILQFAVEKGSFDGGDQGLLNMFFSDWATQDIKKHLPFTYNLSSLAAYTYIPAFKQYGAETRIVHFIGTGKPWLQKLDPSTKIISPTPGAEHLTPMLQRWWDLFCEHVHPHLNKNLDNCNGRLQPEPVEVCSNPVINDINDESLKPCNPEPYAPYREKDDYRQFNLPYQPFDVKGTSGELLNIEFLKASVAPTPPPPEIEAKREEEVGQNQNIEKMEEKKTQEKMEENEEKQETETKKEVPREEEKKVEEKLIIEDPPPKNGSLKDPFNYDTFFPDEKCVNNYLEQNVMTYQPFGHHSHHHKNDHHNQSHHYQQENQNQQQSHQLYQETQDRHHQEVQHQKTIHSEQHNQQFEHSHKSEEHYDNQNHKNQEHHNWETQKNGSDVQNNKSDSQYNVMPLPRFLTIPENDMRQSGNTISENLTHEKPKSDHLNRVKEPTPPFEEFKETPSLPPPSHLEDKPPEKPELKKSKSMPQLDVTKIGTTLKPSVWQSQPNVYTDPKKYLMPKLKPLLPKTNSFNKTVPSSFSRVTLYTEFLMSSDYKEPLGLPKDKIGFVEMQILKEGNLKRSKSEGNLKDKFGPLPYVEEGKKLTTPKKRPFNTLDHSELIDIRECKRQLGNKPKPKENEKKEEMVRPVVSKPTQVKKINLFKRIKSRESMLFEKGKKKVNKKETKKAKENRAPKQELNGQTSSIKKSNEQTQNLKPPVNGFSNSVEDILKKLKNFSKDYIHYFGDIRKKDKTTQKELIVEKISLNNNENKPENTKFEKENTLVSCSISEEESNRNHINGLGTISVENKTLKLKEKLRKPKKIFDVKNFNKQNNLREKDEIGESGGAINELEKTAKPNKNLSSNIPQIECALKKVDNETNLTQSVDKIKEKANESNGEGDMSRKMKLDNLNTIEKLDDGRETGEKKGKSKANEKSENSFSVKKGECKEKEKPSDELINIRETEKVKKNVVVNAVKSSKIEKEVEEAPKPSQLLGNGEKSENSGFVDFVGKKQNEVNHKIVDKVESEDKEKTIYKKEKEESESVKSSLDKCEQFKVSEKISEIENRKAVESGLEFNETNSQQIKKAEHVNPQLESGTHSMEFGNGSKNGVIECINVRSKGGGESEVVEDENGKQQMSGIAGAIAQLNLESAEPSPALQEYIRRQNWETGNMDYMGKDSFDNIWAKICQTVEGKDLELLPGSLPPSQSLSTESQKPGEGVAQPTVSKAEGNVSAFTKTSDLEYIETLPSEPPVRSTEEDEIIFSKPEKGAPLLSNIKEEEDSKAGTPTINAQSTPVSPTPTAIAPQPESKTGTTPSTPQGTPNTEIKTEPTPESKPSADNKPISNIETKAQVTLGNDNKVVVPCTDQIKPQEPATEIKAEAKTPAATEASVAQKAKGNEESKQVENSSTGTPVASQAPASKETVLLTKTGEEAKTFKTEQEITSKIENIQTPSTDSKEISAESLIKAQPIELPQNVEVIKPEMKETQATDSTVSPNTDNLSKDMVKGEKPLVKIKTEATTTPESKEDSAKQGVQVPEKEASASGTVPLQERQVPATPTITPPTPTTPTSMALMVIPKDSKSLVKLSDIIDPKKPVEEEQKMGPTAEPIPMPPIPEPESSEQKKTKSSPTPEPTDQPQKTTRSDSLKENGKQKKGVFSKILEIVGVTPKEKKEGEGDPSNSVFYDVENAKEAISSAENVVQEEETLKEDIKKVPLEEPVSVTPNQEKAKEEEKTHEKSTEENKTVEKGKQGKSKAKPKPARNQKSGDTKSKSPLPQETEPTKQETTVAPATTQSAESQEQNVLEPSSVESVTKEKVKTEIEDILGKAKSEAESRLQAADTEVTAKAEELINTMKLLVDDGKEPPKVEQPDVEELKVTTPEERQKHKGEATKSKLSDQILKAIPPPRRKAISDAKAETSSSTGAIPKTTTPEAAPKEEQKPKEKPAEGGKGGKSPKPSAIPVPPPRNKPKPPQAAPSKGKGKK